MDKIKAYKLISGVLLLVLIGIIGLLTAYIKLNEKTVTLDALRSENEIKQESDLKQEIREKLKDEKLEGLGEVKKEESPGAKEALDREKTKSKDNDSKYSSITICIDPGHGTTDKSVMERISPWGDEEKPGYAYGTTGVATGIPEKDLVLEVSLKLRDELERRGFTVVMTREEDRSDMTNIDRAEFGNSANSDLVVRVHANGLDDQSVKGMMVLVPTEAGLRDAEVVRKSRLAGQVILEEMLGTTGAKSLGLIERDDMTGFNWSKAPVILVEMGFMTNAEEDRLMSTPEYQGKLVEGMASGIIRYIDGQN